jgi:hypothetical protein
MGADAQSASVAYYPRLRLLLGLPGGGALPRVEYIPELFRQLAVWLADDLAGSRGHLILPDDFSPRYVGACVSQTVFREVDRQVLSKFFSERMRGPVDGFDPLRRLRRWSGRHQLTQHALELVEDEAVAERVRAAIVSAHRSWDGAELIETRVGELGRTLASAPSVSALSATPPSCGGERPAARVRAEGRALPTRAGERGRSAVETARLGTLAPAHTR